MNKEDYPKCRTCRHYELEPHGRCRIISDGETNKIAVPVAEEGLAEFYTHPDKFGCSLHEFITTPSPRNSHEHTTDSL